jgi:hypothetical protein
MAAGEEKEKIEREKFLFQTLSKLFLINKLECFSVANTFVRVLYLFVVPNKGKCYKTFYGRKFSIAPH